jgi:hypothetical protein
MKMEQTRCSETSAIKHHKPGNNPKGYTQHVTTDGIILFSKLCEVKMTAEKRYTEEQTCNTAKHNSCVSSCLTQQFDVIKFIWQLFRPLIRPSSGQTYKRRIFLESSHDNFVFFGIPLHDIIKIKYLTIVSGNVLWSYAAGCSVVRMFSLSFPFCVLLLLAGGWTVVCEAVLLGRVVVEMHRCWDVLGLVGSTGV